MVRQIALDLMTQHDLIKKGWRFRFDHAKVRAGMCCYDQKIISVSQHFIESASSSEILDTLLHEIAHALTPKHGHDRVWRQVALAIGCNGKRCHSLKFSRAKYIQKCVNHCWKKEVHRKRKNLICRICKGKVIYGLNGQEEQYERIF